MNGWWSGMDLTAWCGDNPQGAIDLDFALAVANERARHRGVRQRVTLNRGEVYEGFPFAVGDVQVPRHLQVAS